MIEKNNSYGSYALEADMSQLNAFADANKENYANALPFPHTLIENFMDPDLLDEVCKEFPQAAKLEWSEMVDKVQKKYAYNETEHLGPATRKVLHFLNSREIINFLERLTGISGLIPDPHLAGGGLHELRPGGFLKIHADFNWHKQLRLDRRINLILYLNKDWSSDYQGCLELWDSQMKNKVKEYLPLFNNCVIFNTTSTAYHGNPLPVACPVGKSRRSIAVYYYTNGRPLEEVKFEHGSLYKNRPGEASAGEIGRELLDRITPPILFDIYRRFKPRK